MKLKDIFTFLPKSTIKAGVGQNTGKYPFFTSSDTKRLFVNECLYNCEAVILGTGGFPSCNYYNGCFSTSTDTIVLESKGYVLPKFLYYFLRHNNFYVLAKGFHGAGLKHISKEYISEIEIPLLPIPRQQAIIEQMDVVCESCAAINRRIDLYDELVKSRFIELLNEWGCEATPLQEFLDDITYGFTNPMPDAEEGPWKITAKDVVNGKINFDTARKTTQQAYEELTAKSKPDIGTVLLTKDGTLGRCAVVEEDGICVNQSVAVLKCNKKILPKFLAILLQMPEYQREMLKNAGGGTIKHIYITKVVDMLVMVPDVSQQLKFLSFVEQTDKSKLAATETLKYLEELKSSLMDKYFG